MPTWPNRPTEFYIDALRDSDSRMRRQAAAALAVLGDRQAVEPLIHALSTDTDRAVRPVIVRALHRLKDERAIAPLRAVLRAPGVDEDMRYAVRRALVDLGVPEHDIAVEQAIAQLDEQAVCHLVTALADRDSKVRASAAYTLRYVRERAPWVVEPLTAALADVDPDVRRYAAESLAVSGGTQDPGAMPPLIN